MTIELSRDAFGVAGPLVSVAMPFYNTERTLAQAIASILAQTYPKFELLLPDDGSSDRSLSIARSFKDERIRIWSDGRRKRLATRLNECIDCARGAYFARLDADDICYPDRLRLQLEFMLRHPETDLVGAEMLVFRGDGEAFGKITGPAMHADLTAKPLAGIRVWHGVWFGKIDWFREYRYDPRCPLAQDQDMLYRAHRKSRFAALPQPLAGYRQDELSLRKMLRYRWLWMQQRSWYLHGVSGNLKKAQLAAVLLAKAGVDVFAMMSGLKYKVLRHRAMPLGPVELHQWQELWRELAPFRGEISESTAHQLGSLAR